jgi:hypothetical protein
MTLATFEVTRYFDGGGTVVATFPLVPVRLLPSVAVNTYVRPGVMLVVNATLATPLAFVSDVAVANDPPAPVFVHVTDTPEANTGLLLASKSCALIVTVSPAIGDDLLDETAYCAGGPATVVIDVPPVMIPVVVAEMPY